MALEEKSNSQSMSSLKEIKTENSEADNAKAEISAKDNENDTSLVKNEKLTIEPKNEKLDYTGNSEYIEDDPEFDELKFTPPMQIDESAEYINQIYAEYHDEIEDDMKYFEEDSKDNDPDFGQKKKKKKKLALDTFYRKDNVTKNVRVNKPKILECTDDLTKIDNCEDNPNFAVVVDFIEKFGDHLGQKKIPMKELQTMISDQENEPHTDLIKLHANLLRKTKLPKKTLITKKTWENALIMFCHSTGSMVCEGIELQKLGYAHISLSLRLEILKNLMESQFDWNERIRMLVDDLPVEKLRCEPTGTDIEGKIYWTQVSIHHQI